MGFNISLSGIKAASTELDVIGNNIANAGTAGFKKSKAVFTDVYAASVLGTSNDAVGSGVNLTSVNQIFTQGTLTFTDNNLDIAINGQGFFELASNGSVIYTRNGSFEVDRDGYMVTPEGLNVRGYTADLSTVPVTISSNIDNVQIDRSNINPRATTQVDLTMNLPANASNITTAFNPNDATTYTNSTQATVYDSLGNSHELRYYYVKIPDHAPSVTSGRGWAMYATLNGTNVNATGAVAIGGGPPASYGGAGGEIPTVFEFGNGGTGVTYIGASLPVANQPPVYNVSTVVAPAATQNITLDMTSTTQFGSPFSVQALSQDGYATGRLDSVDVDGEGIIFGRYTNGQNRPLGQLVLSNFSNPNGLQPLGDTTWAETYNSGEPVQGAPGTGSLGAIQSGALEDSNTDLTEELVRLIIAQRNFQANAQAVRTDDTVTQTILNFR